MARISLSSPWVLYYHEVEAFFKADPEVNVVYDEKENILKLFVDNQTKADALMNLMPPQKDFGSVTLIIMIIPSNTNKPTFKTFAKTDTIGLIAAALEDNDILSSIQETTLFTKPITYVVFKPQIIQYFTDSLADINGLCSTLAQDIAKDIFTEIDGVYYCTDKVKRDTITATINPWGCATINTSK